MPGFLTTEWILAQFAAQHTAAHRKYQQLVKEGIKSQPWEEPKGQIYLGSEEFVAEHCSDRKQLTEIPQRQAVRPTLEQLLARGPEQAILRAYREHGYRLREIARHLGVH